MSDALEKKNIILLAIFAVAFAFVESSVVVYLRAIYYPQGFMLPLKMMTAQHLRVEILREFATMMMLAAAAFLAGASPLQRFCCFLIAFGIWDLFYYIWLKVLLNWPSTLFDWDILFLIPVPWIGPVIAPALLSMMMIIGGILLFRKGEITGSRRQRLFILLVTVLGTGLILFSFICDTEATLRLQLPRPYHYDLLIGGITLYVFALIGSLRTL